MCFDTCHFLKAESGTCRIPCVSTNIRLIEMPLTDLAANGQKAAETVLDYPMLDLHVIHTIEHALSRYPVLSDLNAWCSDCVIGVQLAVGTTILPL